MHDPYFALMVERSLAVRPLASLRLQDPNLCRESAQRGKAERNARRINAMIDEIQKAMRHSVIEKEAGSEYYCAGALAEANWRDWGIEKILQRPASDDIE